MKKHLKILLSVFILSLFTFAFLPEIILGTPAAPAVGNWYQQFMPNIGSRSIQDIFFIDSLTGWAVTNGTNQNPDTNFVLKTTNAGDTWIIHFKKIVTGSGFPGYNKIYFLNQSTGFACSVRGFDKSTDGGTSWTTLYSSESFQDISVLNIDTIWLASGNPLTGGVFRTTNGGTSWVQQYSAGTQNPEKIYMYNARIGFISDNSGASSIRKTTNGGLNWNMNVNGEWFYDINFIDSLTGWRTRGDTMKYTSNGGNTWNKQTMPYGGMIFTSNLLRFSVLNKDTIWGSGGYLLFPNNSVKSILFRTTNGGNNWLFQLPDTSLLPFEQFVKFTDKFHGWYYSTNYTGIHTASGGDPIWLTAIEQTSNEVPKDFMLFQNYPNPFNPVTKIKFNITNTSSVAQTFLSVYNLLGKKVSTLINGQLTPGTYEIDFDASGMASGVYFYRLTVTAGKEVYTDTKKMLLIK